MLPYCSFAQREDCSSCHSCLPCCEMCWCACKFTACKEHGCACRQAELSLSVCCAAISALAMQKDFGVSITSKVSPCMMQQLCMLLQFICLPSGYYMRNSVPDGSTAACLSTHQHRASTRQSNCSHNNGVLFAQIHLVVLKSRCTVKQLQPASASQDPSCLDSPMLCSAGYPPLFCFQA